MSNEHSFEKQASKDKMCFILEPGSRLKTFWNVLIVILLAYTATYSPFKIAFIDDDGVGTFSVELLIDLLFFIDIIVNFISAYVIPETGMLEIRPQKIAMSYLTSWFLVDLGVSFPYELVETRQTGANYSSMRLIRLAKLPKLYRIFRIFRIFKLLRLIKYNKTFKAYIERLKMSAGVLRMIQVSCAVLFMVHLMSCFWFLSSKFDDF